MIAAYHHFITEICSTSLCSISPQKMAISALALEHPQAEQYRTIFRMIVSFQPVEIWQKESGITEENIPKRSV